MPSRENERSVPYSIRRNLALLGPIRRPSPAAIFPVLQNCIVEIVRVTVLPGIDVGDRMSGQQAQHVVDLVGAKRCADPI